MSPAERSGEISMEELAALVETAGGECVGSVLQQRAAPDPRTFIGEGKVAELKELIANADCQLAVFDNELTPSQMRVLGEELGVRVLDRSGLILDIFAQRARTREGQLQVELAQYEYLLPRLTRRPRAGPRPSARAAPARRSWRPTGGTSAARYRSCARSSSRCARCAPSSAAAASGMPCPSWR